MIIGIFESKDFVQKLPIYAKWPYHGNLANLHCQGLTLHAKAICADDKLYLY
jgi:hypothetical protein